jgi:hypothetical protein
VPGLFVARDLNLYHRPNHQTTFDFGPDHQTPPYLYKYEVLIHVRLTDQELVLAPLDGLEVDALLDHLPQGAHLAQLGHVVHRQLHRAVHLCAGAYTRPPFSST